MIRFRLCPKSKPPKGIPKPKVRRCSEKRDPCPVVRVYKRSVTITDDYGSKVRMKREEFDFLLKSRPRI